MGAWFLLLILLGAFTVFARGFRSRTLSRWVGRAFAGLLLIAFAPMLATTFFAALPPSQRALLSAVGLGLIGLAIARLVLGDASRRNRRNEPRRRRPARPDRRHVSRALGPPPAYRALQAAVHDGRIRPGADLYDGSPLPMVSAYQGHYASPRNFQDALERMNRDPWMCDWCGRGLPAHFAAEHLRPHDHATDIRHHFHPECFAARNEAIRVIRGGSPAGTAPSESFEHESVHIERHRWHRQ